MRIVIAGAHGQRRPPPRPPAHRPWRHRRRHRPQPRSRGGPRRRRRRPRPSSTSSRRRSTSSPGSSPDADAVVFAAGAGPGSGAARKHTVDHAAAVLLADAAERAGVRAVPAVSSMGVEQVAEGDAAQGMDAVFAAYLQAKLRGRGRGPAPAGLDVTMLRPAALTDDPGTGRVTLGRGIEFGEIPRDDVAARPGRLLRARRGRRGGRGSSAGRPRSPEAVAALA